MMVGEKQLIVLALSTMALSVYTRPAMRIDIPTIMQELTEAREALHLQRYIYDGKLQKAKEALRNNIRQDMHIPGSDIPTWPDGQRRDKNGGVMENFGRVI